MTLEEAKEVLRQDINFYDAVDEMAIETVLKALEDSIPKEKVKEMITALTEGDNLVINEYWDSADVVCAKREEMAVVGALKELLDKG